ncbi:MAG TPA: metal-dependent hydrolase [Bacteroidia bacterium]|jgi:inner membrane protein
MDSVTHLVMGATFGDALLGKKIGKPAMLWGALAASIPDIDVIFVPFFDPPFSLTIHRGFTHSVLFAVLVIPLLAYLFSKRYNRAASFKDWSILFALGLFSHIFIDACTSYGTGWFEPFSHYRVTFNNIFVADPVYTLPLLVSTIALWIIRKDSGRRGRWQKIGLVGSTLYLGLTFANKAYVNSVFHSSLEEQQIKASRFFSTPTPLNNLLWMGVAEDSTGYHIGYFSDLDKDHHIAFHYVPKNDSLLAGKDPAVVETLKWFSGNYYCVTGNDSAVRFNDLRFGQFPGWVDPNAPFAFSFNLNRKGKQNALQRGNFKGSVSENFSKLLRRIAGK